MKYISASKKYFLSFCNEITGPATVFAMGVVIIGEIYRVSKIEEPSTTVSAEYFLHAGYAAALFGMFLIFLSLVWFMIAVYDWLIPILENGFNNDEKNITMNIIKAVLIGLVALVVLYSILYGLGGSVLMVLFQ